MPPLNNFDKTLIALALSQTAATAQAASITASPTYSIFSAIAA